MKDFLHFQHSHIINVVQKGGKTKYFCKKNNFNILTKIYIKYFGMLKS